MGKGRPGGNPDLGHTNKTPTTGGINSHLEDSFHNVIEPTVHIERERPWHRVAVFMHAQGKDFVEIAEALNKSTAAVGQVVKQPWAQEQLIRETTDAGRDAITTIYETYGPATLLEVIDLGQTAKSENVKLEARKYFLNRWLGMPKESMQVSAKPSETKTDDELRASVNTILDGLGRPPGVSNPAAG